MRRIVVVIALSLFAGSIVGCGGSEKTPPTADPNAPKPPAEPKDGP